MTVKVEEFIKDYLHALENDNAALFVGAGLSRPEFVDWKELLRDVIEDLDLSLDRETDLITVAQYHVNERGGRARLNRLLIEEFTKDATITKNHQLIASLPIHTVWTTNYDKLLEQAFEQAYKRVDVRSDPDNFQPGIPKRDVTIYKMHGDVSYPSKAVLTRDDYEGFNIARQAFSTQLAADLTSKTFLFLGYSFNDPNVEYILSRIRILMGPNRPDHYYIMKRPDKPKSSSAKAKADYDYEVRRQELRTADLKRYGIQSVMIDDFGEITEILDTLNNRIHRRDVFVSGSAHDYSPLELDRVQNIASKLGKRIIKNGYNLISGFGLGIGSIVLAGALEESYANKKTHFDDRTTLRPFPLDNPELWDQYRRDMISKAGFCIFLCGNKLENGTVVRAGGVEKEFKIAKEMGKVLIPIGATGWVAKELWDEVHKNFGSYFSNDGIKKQFQMLNDANKTDDEIVEAVFSILKQLSK